jgi:ABC-type multidrug transport system fused ATPase/permease subunit
MKPAYVTYTIYKAFKQRKIFWWGILLTISATGPLLTTYMFSQGVGALEANLPLKHVLTLFFGVLAISSVEIFMRMAAKTRVNYYVEAALIKLQLEFLKNVKVRGKNRKPTVQSIRNLTRSLQLFTEHFINTGVSGFVSFVSVPFILFFIDKRIFFVELALMLIYLVATFIYAHKYEKLYERYDETRESYFIKMSTSNKISGRGRRMAQAIHKLQNIRFFEWASVQNIYVIFQFVITAIIVVDIVNGHKGISDLVLIIGYTKESQKFLNSVTSDLNRAMQVRAGIERLVINSSGAKPGSVISLT